VDKACAKCGKGLHSGDDCPRVFQQGFVAPQPGAQARLVQGELPLNEK
jgi:hypothetical protein